MDPAGHRERKDDLTCLAEWAQSYFPRTISAGQSDVVAETRRNEATRVRPTRQPFGLTVEFDNLLRSILRSVRFGFGMVTTSVWSQRGAVRTTRYNVAPNFVLARAATIFRHTAGFRRTAGRPEATGRY